MEGADEDDESLGTTSKPAPLRDAAGSLAEPGTSHGGAQMPLKFNAKTRPQRRISVDRYLPAMRCRKCVN